jgi:hypothetical protein
MSVTERVKSLLGAGSGASSGTCAAVADLAAVGSFAALKEKLAASSEDSWKKLAEAAQWDKVKASIERCGYEDTMLGELVVDLAFLGSEAFVSRLPSSLLPREVALVHRFLEVFFEAGVTTAPTIREVRQSDSPLPAPGRDNVFLGQVMAAAARQDSKAIEELTSQIDPVDQLRSLVAAARQGEPLRELEPDESALRAARTARKSNRFLAYEAPKVETVVKLPRPLAAVLSEELPRLWAAALEGRLAWGDPMNWVGQVAEAARDRSVSSPQQAEKAAAVFGLRLLHEAYTASKRGASDTQGRENVSTVLGEMNWPLLQRCQAEVSASGGHNAEAGRGAAADGAIQTFCLRHLEGKCNAATSQCRFKHGCPFCRTGAEKAKACFENHIRQLGWQSWQAHRAPAGPGGYKGAGRAADRDRSRSRRRGGDVDRDRRF